MIWCRWWCCVLVGIAAGILVYILIPSQWLLFIMCAAVVIVGFKAMFK